MINGYDIAYGLGVAIASPYWLLKSRARRKVLNAFGQRMGQVHPRSSDRPAVMIHAVSVGEINATQSLVEQLRTRRPDLHIIISVTTETGHARGLQLYGKDPANLTLIRYPLDFTPAVSRVLDQLRPSVVVLMELEVWPNFLRQCALRKIPVILANGRLTEPSYRKYKRIKPIAAAMFRRLSAVCAQDEIYANRFIDLGAPRDRVRVTGTMKFDTAELSDRVKGDEELAADLGLQRGGPPLWVCGSTGPGEESIVLQAYRELIGEFPTLRLAIIPRKPERFDEVAGLIEQAGFKLIRRSQGLKGERSEQAVILGDTMGELRKFYSLATVVLVGRTLVDLGPKQHGSDMIEPAALAKPTIVGSFTGNFADTMRAFRAVHSMVEIGEPSELQPAVARLLTNIDEASKMASRAREVVRNGQGATARHAELILSHLRG